jgi:hypothetical protein
VWAKTQEEANLVHSFVEKKQIRDFDENDTKELIDVISKWRYYTGCTKDVTAQDFVVIAMFIGKNWDNLTLDEINLIIDLSMVGKLDVDVNTYGNFSPLYISRIIQAYLDYKKDLLLGLMQRRDEYEQKQLADQQTKPIPEESMENMIYIIKAEYARFNQHSDVSDPFNIVYNFLKRTKRLNIDTELTKQALEYGNRMAKTTMIQQTLSDNGQIKEISAVMSDDEYRLTDKQKDNKDKLVKKYARNYCVQKYFTSRNIDEIVKSITIKEFQDEHYR